MSYCNIPGQTAFKKTLHLLSYIIKEYILYVLFVDKQTNLLSAVGPNCFLLPCLSFQYINWFSAVHFDTAFQPS